MAERERWWRGYGWGVGLALAAGLALRVWFVLHAPVVSGDGVLYSDLARNWFGHGVYGLTRGDAVRPTLIRLPGYPVFLGVCFALGAGSRGVMLVQAVVDLVTCGLVASAAGRLYGVKAGLAALWLAAVCPFMANYVGTVLTETLSIFCVGLVLYGFVRRWTWVVGVGLALAVLLRPEQGLLAAAVVPAMVWRDRRLGPAVLAALLTVAPLGPWAVRNWVTFHVVQPLAPRNANDPGEAVPVGFQRWFRTWGLDAISNDQVYWNYDSDVILPESLPARAFDSADQRARTVALLAEYNQTTTGTAAFDARFGALAAERVRFWRYYVRLPLGRLGDMLFRPRTELLAVPMDWWHWGRRAWVAVVFGVVNLGYFVLAGWGFWRTRVWGTPVGAAMLGFCMLRCAMLATIDNAEPRYTLELFPVLIVWGSAVFSGGLICGRWKGSFQA